MHTSRLKLVYVHNRTVHVSANHVAIFKDTKYRAYIHLNCNARIMGHINLMFFRVLYLTEYKLIWTISRGLIREV
jgi:acyl-ACP thioesterase